MILLFFRTLLPSWRFFEKLTPIPKIFFKIVEATDPQIISNEWKRLGPNQLQEKSLLQMFHNPAANLTLSFWSQVEQLLNDISIMKERDYDQIQNLSSYLIVLRNIKSEIGRRYPACKSFEFKISVIQFDIKTQNHTPQEVVALVSSKVGLYDT